MPPPDADSQTRQRRFMELLAPVHDRLARFAHALTRNRDEARDLVGETLLLAWEHFDALRDESLFASYCFTIAHREHVHRRRRARWLGRFDERAAQRIPDRGTSPESSADIRLLYEALDALPARQREAVMLFEIGDLSLEEIQRVQGGSLSGVKSRVTRGREKLAELLGARPQR